ncbi:multiple sugar transport system permease protein [Pararobbsia alpina]|uniref:carbohydrate ABC transporter permease n=1 Tax=Pararobbsia alpina TaxID=621374 RepID=UPI0039A72B71
MSTTSDMPVREQTRKESGTFGHERTSRLVLMGAVVVGAVSMAPLYWAFISSLRPGQDILKYLSPLSIWTFIPNRLTFSNLVNVLDGPFGRSMFNSVVVALVTIVLGLVICSMAAFALAKLRLPGKSVIFSIVVVSFLIPFDAIAVPLLTLFRQVGLQNTYLGIILPGVGNGFAVFMLRQFFLGIPAELAEAARIDGLGWFGVFARIYIPLSGPALISAGLILFVFQWQAFLWPLLIAPDPSYKVAAVATADFAGQFSTDFGSLFAATVIVSIVPLIVLLVFQRYFTASMATSGTKE